MEHRIIVAGFGGQGVLLIGNLICHAGMEEGNNVAWLPSYGPEMRGGTASCSVTVSDDEIGSPIVTQPDICIVMNQPSLDKYLDAVQPGGKLFINSSLIKPTRYRDDIETYLVPTSEVAQEVGNLRTANMVMLGAVAAITGVVKTESAVAALREAFGERRAHLIPVNEKAMALGAERTEKV
ncbi:MAG: 2-oxoacid:acceptor oxidoreductase family protein [Clostridia bacterium]|nr:2-oxoacid:acceptor oxidoreductase family protein [Clostridia bacterium]